MHRYVFQLRMGMTNQFSDRQRNKVAIRRRVELVQMDSNGQMNCALLDADPPRDLQRGRHLQGLGEP